MVLILVAVAGAVTFACSVCAAPPVPQVEAPVAFALLESRHLAPPVIHFTRLKRY